MFLPQPMRRHILYTTCFMTQHVLCFALLLFPCIAVSFHIETIPNRNSPPAILLRQAWREGQRIRRKTLANLTALPPEVVDGLRALLKGGVVFESLADAVAIRRALPHGHVAAVLGTAARLGLPRRLHRHASRERDLALAAVVARVLEPASKLATARQLSPDTASSSLGTVLGLGEVKGNEMLAMLDWLCRRQRWIERGLARRHLGHTLVLYDVTSSYLEGRSCPLAAFGHNRDGKKGRPQIVFGLLCAADGCPVAVEVFSGNTADPRTVGAQVAKLRERFELEQVALVGDRGMLTTARIRADLEPAGLDWISALKTGHLRQLLKPSAEQPAALQLQDLSPDQVVEVRSPDFPGERLLVCLNPRLREERRRRREALLEATEGLLEQLAAAVRSGRLRGRDAINRRLGRELNRKKMEKHFEVTVGTRSLGWTRRQEKIDAEAALDGIYAVRTSLDAAALGTEQAVAAYKSLSQVEAAFRSMKTAQLKVRPIYLSREPRVRAHVFLCMLAYYVEWHLRQALAPMLFEDDDRAGARARRNSPVEPARPSGRAQAKAASKRTGDGLPVHSFRTLLQDLATLTYNEVTLPREGGPAARNKESPAAGRSPAFPLLSTPTPVQDKALGLLEIDLARSVSM